MKTFLQGMSIRFFRGIGPDIQRICPLSSLNLFIGENNAGKSIVLDFLHERFPFVKRERGTPSSERPTDQYRGEKSGRLFTAIGIHTESVYAYVHEAFKKTDKEPFNARDATTLKKFINAISIEDHVWLDKEPQKGQNWPPQEVKNQLVEKPDISAIVDFRLEVAWYFTGIWPTLDYVSAVMLWSMLAFPFCFSLQPLSLLCIGSCHCRFPGCGSGV